MQILKNQRGNAVLVVVIVLLLAAAGFIYFSSQNQGTPETVLVDEEVMEEKVTTETLNVAFNPEEGFNGGNSVTLTEDDGAIRVVVSLSEISEVPQPVHIHSGSCSELGGVEYPLSDIVGGVSETLLPVSLDDLKAQLPLSVNAHKSAEELDVYVACGNLPGGDAMMEEGSETKTFNLTGTNFAFSQNEIRVKQGDIVKIVFTSNEGFHDWTIDEFSAATARLTEGNTTEVEFVASETGTFEYYCSVGNHRQLGMVGNLIVE